MHKLIADALKDESEDFVAAQSQKSSREDVEEYGRKLLQAFAVAIRIEINGLKTFGMVSGDPAYQTALGYVSTMVEEAVY